MKTESIIYYPLINTDFLHDEIENAFHDSLLCYSFRHLTYIEGISQENLLEALQKSLLVCRLAGINSKHHFKQIFVFDSVIETLLIDWRMSKTGFNLLIIQMPFANEQLASWLWKLADYKTQ
jgi:hypothetical protein